MPGMWEISAVLTVVVVHDWALPEIMGARCNTTWRNAHRATSPESHTSKRGPGAQLVKGTQSNPQEQEKKGEKGVKAPRRQGQQLFLERQRSGASMGSRSRGQPTEQDSASRTEVPGGSAGF